MGATQLIERPCNGRGFYGAFQMVNDLASVKLCQQQPEGGIRRRLDDMGAQQLVQRRGCFEPITLVILPGRKSL